MKSDPDFHPLAGAWINGSAMPPERQLLGEILAEQSKAMEEFSSLCRLEVFLYWTPVSEEDRREALRTMLFRRSWPQRAAHAVRRRAAWGFAAAAALLALGLWYFWQNEKLPGAKRRPSPIAMGQVLASTGTAGAGTIVPPAPGLEERLRRSFVPAFKVHGGLTDAGVTLMKQMRRYEPDITVTLEVRNAGDAPVHLHLDCSLPAWSILQIMAIQSGTRLQLSGSSLIFLADATPLPFTGSLTGTSTLDPLRLLLGVGDLDSHGEELDLFAGLVETRFDGIVVMELASESSARFTGSPRLVKAVECALAAIARPALEVRYDVTVLVLPAGTGVPGGLIVPPTPGSGGLGGIFDATQTEDLLRGLKENREARVIPVPSVTGLPNAPVIIDLSNAVSRGKNRAVMAGTFTCTTPTEEQLVDLSCHMDCTSLPLPPDSKSVSDTQVMLWAGQTLGLGGFKSVTGAEVSVLITPVFIEPGAAENPATPQPRRKTGVDFSYGLSVPEKPGMAYSPYAKNKGAVDVKGLVRGTLMKCPYTGQSFRVP